MYRYIIRRLIAMPLLLLGIASIAFLLTHFTKGDPLISIIGERQMDNPVVIAAARARWGLDRSLPEQYLTYVGNLLSGDFGTSLERPPWKVSGRLGFQDRPFWKSWD